MNSRTKFVLGIITAWILFVLALLFTSSYISKVGLADLEHNLAIEDTNRVNRIINSSLQNIYSLNIDAAYWDETYNYVQNPNKEFTEKNYSNDVFKDYNINYVLILNKDNEIVWSKGYDFIKKVAQKVPDDLANFFKKNSLTLLKNKDDYNTIEEKAEGVAGFVQTIDNNIDYFALNYVKDSDDTKPYNGFIIYGKNLSQELFAKLSEEFDYKISLIPMSEFSKTSLHDEVIANAKDKKAVLTKPINDDLLKSYKVLNDINSKPIGVIEVELPRTLYNQSLDSSFWQRLMLLAVALAAMGALSSLIYHFFKKHDLLTKAFERFVPHKLIELLQKKDIIEVNLGNSSERVVSVLFMDIRNFTSISEGLSPQDTFDFINVILKDIAPIIDENNGFIDKYIGDCIMALFHKKESHADDAIRAGMLILDEIDKLNYTGKLTLATPVHVGIGINTGNSILGIIGASGRLEGTVISDTINTASRIQSLTKTYDHAILISEDTFKDMKHPEYYTITHVDDVQIRGRSVKTSIYKVEKRKS
jgi:class 3 adenylate cyclase/sensor domain CHASE-containing protein